jgi:2-polyprenyl-3-methyl-5-hydroxy-6-metoxy-1,4-benzoquinol methylase
VTSGVAADGSPVALYLALPGRDDAALILGAIEPGAAVLELGCGVGRVTRHLAAGGHTVMAAAEGLRVDEVLNASRTWVRLT